MVKRGPGCAGSNKEPTRKSGTVRIPRCDSRNQAEGSAAEARTHPTVSGGLSEREAGAGAQIWGRGINCSPHPLVGAE